MYLIVVLVGVRVAHANDSRDLIFAAVVGASGVGLLATVPGDDTVLASLLLTRIVISAALSLLVREQRRGVKRARRAAVQDVRELVETLRTVDEDDEGFVPQRVGRNASPP